MQDDFAIERLDLRDVPANVALSQRVGWKDVESEWRVLHEAGEARGVRKEGQIVAQGVLGSYGSAATLAKMVVAPELQGRGLGARLLDGFILAADAAGTPIGLCATDQGRPLYASRGFEVSGELMIMVGTPHLGPVSGSVVALGSAEPLVACDRRFSGCDRQRMLRARFRESSVRLQLGDEPSAVALASPQGQGSLVGPIIAESEDAAQQLAAALFAAAPGPVRIDVPIQHAAFRRWLVERGLREMSVRVEMVRGRARSPWQVAQRYALCTQAWG
jgi:GNAT superfamily N-acetyltransferase